MSCPRELILSIHADGELRPAEAERLERHLAGCPACAERLRGLRLEAELLRATLAMPPRAAPGWLAAGARRLLPLAAATMSLLVLLRAAWQGAAGALGQLPHWLNPLELAGSLNLLFSSVFFLFRPGGAPLGWAVPLASAGLALLAVGLAGGWLLRRRPRLAAPLALSLALLALLAVPAGAVELRQGDIVELAAGEAVDGTLLMAGETIRVEGDVAGDLVAFGRNVTVRGNVGGGIYAFAQNVEVEGGTGGSLHLFGQWLRLAGGVAGSGYMFAQGVDIRPGSRIEGDVMMFGETLEAEGTVGRDLLACGARFDLRGEVGRDVEAWTERVDLGERAVVAGDLTARLPSRKLLNLADGATVGGDVSVVPPRVVETRSRWADPGFYVWKMVFLVGALLVGAVLWSLAPGLMRGRLAVGGAVLARLGLGLLVLVATPIALVLTGFTLIGLPLALIGLAVYLVALYLAKILAADLLGRALLGWPEETARGALPALALGLAILTVAGLIPWLGGLIGFLALVLGLGLLTHRLWRRAPGS